ncbi:F-actin-capping protein subunit alpha [Lachnellula suecica]|uniref:F-actin-capping protein subunit alpha n=1 Tax=Lachnellula suecica TaxID=602035 RepID=A0A8T9CJE4_9HELO|nr:F-actin-capping protein subunit alpha [Lachnellula suecica]
MASQLATVSAFVEGAPPGELADVIADIKALTIESPNLVSQLGPAFEKYNEEQFTTVKLPGSSQHVSSVAQHGAGIQLANAWMKVVISSHNSLGDGRYYDVESSSSFAFDHSTQKASGVQSHVLESSQSDLVKSLLKSLSTHVKEHYSNASYGVYPIEDDSKIAIVVVANKYSPNNFWNGRWRSLYIFSPSSSSLTGSIKVDVHYYEDGNVRLLTTKPVSATVSSASASTITREITVAEKKYQEEVNKGFTNLSEGAFKGLRRQLPITRQKIEWDKIAGYRLGQDIGGGSSKR